MAPVALEQPPEHSHPLDPEVFLRGPGVRRTLTLAETSVTPFATSLIVLANAGPEEK